LQRTELTPEQLEKLQTFMGRLKSSARLNIPTAGFGAIGGAIGGGLAGGPMGAAIGAPVMGASLGLGGTIGQMINLNDLKDINPKEAKKLAAQVEKEYGKQYADNIREFARKI
jgi:outer membrane lipoprotein SlyB